MRFLPLFLLLACAAGFFLPWLVAGDGAIVLRDPAKGLSLAEAPRALNLLAAEDGPLLLGMAGAAFLLLLLGLVWPRRRWPRVLAFLVLAGLTAFCYIDWQQMNTDETLLRMGDYIFGAPRGAGIGAQVSTIAALLAGLITLLNIFRR